MGSKTWVSISWPDNPFDGKPFTNQETDDYSPVKNFYIHDNVYEDPCDLLCVRPTNFRGDTEVSVFDSVLSSVVINTKSSSFRNMP